METPTLLVVQASPRGEHSISRNLARTFVAQWKAAHPGGAVVERDLAATDLPYVTLPWLGASLTPLEQHTPEMKEVLRVSDALVAELLTADHVAISTPVYNFNVPANLKSYVDHVVRKGLTIGPTGAGLLGGRKGTILLASGGVYTEGSPIRDRDIATAYLRLVYKVLGIEDVTVVAAGGTKVVDLGERSRNDFLRGFEAAITAAAQADRASPNGTPEGRAALSPALDAVGVSGNEVRGLRIETDNGRAVARPRADGTAGSAGSGENVIVPRQEIERAAVA